MSTKILISVAGTQVCSICLHLGEPVKSADLTTYLLLPPSVRGHVQLA